MGIGVASERLNSSSQRCNDSLLLVSTKVCFVINIQSSNSSFSKSSNDGEKLLKASQCYLSTTSGLIAGLLFISTHKIAFCSDKSIKISSSNGELIRVHYKVSIPLEKIQQVNQSQNMMKPSEKYIEIVTVDGFDFWFMGFFNYKKALRYLQQAISQAQREKVKMLNEIGNIFASSIML
ncbi:putative GRAM domain, PH domain-containing protein [Medicago truncatula]|uniref:Putative GRAM domain, PH domain-containing protein n=1 Tax=Medicago truncatula TaxID=3880 RepID=A0A396JZP4_MEDTR|nr:putative GRAM domain, PH domain-containing protein [Medicago truncatula]